ncbi:MAG: hypothetical protein UDO63_07075 [Oscillospiraceae bacterium]
MPICHIVELSALAPANPKISPSLILATAITSGAVSQNPREYLNLSSFWNCKISS